MTCRPTLLRSATWPMIRNCAPRCKPCARLDRWMVETHDLGPESEKACDANLADELNHPSAKDRKEAIRKNSARMKQWAKEGK